jgi:aryl carrier-like protein
VVGGEALPPATVRAWQAVAPATRLVNEYGPTETVVGCTAYALPTEVPRGATVSIGRPIAAARVYVVDAAATVVPVGVTGELWIGGAGVARGYLGQPGLTAARFTPDPWGPAGTRVYRTGDLGRWRADGTLDYVGRDDFQVKVRGYRVELEEVVARLRAHPAVGEAVVCARPGPAGPQLVAYYTAGAGVDAVGPDMLRAHMAETLPEYMVPAAYVRVATWPLTANGKLDRAALPTPGDTAYAGDAYAAPVGALETQLAQIWADVLQCPRVGRHDNFFELGGHSLLAMKVVARLRHEGRHSDIVTLFAAPTLAGFARSLESQPVIDAAPPNGIPAGTDIITPAMLPLVSLTPGEIGVIVRTVEGGAANVQDIYPLAPLQRGMLFHRLMGGAGDPYVHASVYSFDDRVRLDAYLEALTAVIARHDILRTGFVWEDVPEPVQVVWRDVVFSVDQVTLNPDDADGVRQLSGRCGPQDSWLDIRRPPLLRLTIAPDDLQDRWLLMQVQHHLIGDHTTVDIVNEEIEAHLRGREDDLPTPIPFRNLVARMQAGPTEREHESYFRGLLGDVDEPTAPFGLLEVHGDGLGLVHAAARLDFQVGERLREQARVFGVSAASICHVAWAQVLARITGRDDVVFGTVLLGRMQGDEAAERGLGMFMNTLPVRLRAGAEGVGTGIRRAHDQLLSLLRHEHASLALAQRCSAVTPPTPLFTSLLNYRHSASRARPRTKESARAWKGIRKLHAAERTNYPITMSIDDLDESGFGLKAQVVSSVSPTRVCGYMQTALESLVIALEDDPSRPLVALEVLPEVERQQLAHTFNRATVDD